MRGRPPKASKLTYTCQQCGKQWEQYPWETDRTQYCSRSCFHKSSKGRQKVLRAEREERPCLRCGKIFLVGGTDRHSYSKYCSRTCARHGYWGELHKPARQMKEVEIAWVAGVVDGEGCIGWPRRPLLHSIYLSVTNTNERFMEKVAEVTGTGRIKVKQQTKKNPHHSAAWTWVCYGDNARSILRQILPWLIVKREAAEVALGIVKATEPPWTQRTRTMNARTSTEASGV